MPSSASDNKLPQYSINAATQHLLILGIVGKSFCGTTPFIFVKLLNSEVTLEYPNNRISFAKINI